MAGSTSRSGSWRLQSQSGTLLSMTQEQLLGFSVAVLGMRAAWANNTLHVREYEEVPELVQRFSSLSGNEAVAVCRFAAEKSRSNQLYRHCLEFLALALPMHEFLKLIARMRVILEADGRICDSEREFLFDLYLLVTHILTKEEGLHREEVNHALGTLAALLHELAGRSEKSRTGKIFQSETVAEPAPSSSRFTILSPDEEVVYQAEIDSVSDSDGRRS